MIVSRPAHDGRTTEHQSRRSLALHSTVAAVLGSGVTVLVHEATHLVAVLGLVGQGRLYPYGAQYDGELDGVSTAVVALAGPAVSLALGLTLLLTLSRARVVGPWHLVRLWCGASSYVVGAGYLFITPFAPVTRPSPCGPSTFLHGRPSSPRRPASRSASSARASWPRARSR
ncbi:hypothetical protein BJF80_15340 [Serinicoccus sp. CUA-874]|uniref:hypothetical protein n=1 Tax=Serinicoccus sp. CUA-874 TaxID=1517939 RepID=UPI000966B4F8|nr:hypothetical protein [Serinicoccus sp. CUA-874]OLT18376.1 hypothetical protein BJF80_15340 [Serinicoccus sp. CUA-874]